MGLIPKCLIGGEFNVARCALDAQKEQDSYLIEAQGRVQNQLIQSLIGPVVSLFGTILMVIVLMACLCLINCHFRDCMKLTNTRLPFSSPTGQNNEETNSRASYVSVARNRLADMIRTTEQSIPATGRLNAESVAMPVTANSTAPVCANTEESVLW